jgi:hypothetical protein
MQIVINLDDKLYNRIKYLEPRANSMLDELMRSVQNGTLLPKGHGRLIDADEILNHAHIEEDEDGDIFVKKWYCIEKDVFDNALVLIDGEVEE